MTDNKYSTVKYVVVPILMFIAYIGINVILELSVPSAGFFGTVVIDAVLVIILGYVYNRYYRTPVTDDYRFSEGALVFLFFLTALITIFGTAMANVIHNHYPSEGLSVYSSVQNSGFGLTLYIISALSVGPIFEEILFRGFLYKVIRKKIPLFGAFAVSAVLFTLIHGTTEHVPLTVILTLLNCFVIEITGKIWHVVAIHILSNLFSIVYHMQIPMGETGVTVVYVILLLALTVLLSFVSQMKDLMKKGRFKSIEQWADDKRRDMINHDK